ncbi:MAG: MCP four helix bundle domain-containing protein [Flammeovirgaceae bacterium]|nr:MCP four helix bundle domain-containing protein [Flammeovirgaceae bacterium]
MNWTYIIKQKTKAAIALGVVFLLVIGTNLLDKKYFSDLQDSFSSMYEDRLMAEIYIYQFSHLFYKKKILTESLSDSSNINFLKKNPILNDSISTLLNLYEGTKLTEKEAEIFKGLKAEINELLMLESSIESNSDAQKLESKNELIHNNISYSLNGLSEIQHTEGKQLINNSKQIIASNSITSQLEMGILIVIGLIMQALVFSSKSIISKISQNNNLN